MQRLLDFSASNISEDPRRVDELPPYGADMVDRGCRRRGSALGRALYDFDSPFTSLCCCVFMIRRR